MSLAAAAQHIASKGRHGDTTLVHMAPQELAGLHALARAHGKKITTNPDTGLPEAFSLKSLLPMLAGAALTIGSGGTLSPLMAAGIVGGGTTLATGSLNKGLMAGLGAFGGAGLTGSLASLSTAGAPAAGASVTGAGASAVPSVASGVGAGTTGIAGVTPGFESMAGETFFSQPVAQQGITLGPANVGAPTAAPAMASTFPPAQAPVQMANAFEMTKPTLANVSSGFQNALRDPSQLMTFDTAKYAMGAATPGLMEQPKQAAYEGGGANPYQYEYSANPTGATPGSPEPYYFRPSYRRLADGGLAALAAGGASHLGDYSDGGRLLRGPGDGVSDDIPASIADKRPARLADGEFVIPARIVSELGNGSTDAGARKLYAMMDRVQKARNKTVGKGKVAVNSRAEKLLPA